MFYRAGSIIGRLVMVAGLILLLHPAGHTQKQFSGLATRDIPGGRVIKTEKYGRNSLWGYINGGADLYLEYGFKRLTAQDIFISPNNYKVNVYEMSSPGSAFGIFSVSHRKCNTEDSLSPFNCSSAYHLQLTWGSYYLSIINSNGTPGEQRESLRLAKILTSKLKRKKLILPSWCEIPLLSPFLKDLRHVRGRLGLENGLPAWTGKFGEAESFSLYQIQVETAGGEAEIFQIDIKDGAGLTALFKNLEIPVPSQGQATQARKDGKTIWCRRIGDETFIYLESSMKKEDTDLYVTTLSGPSR